MFNSFVLNRNSISILFFRLISLISGLIFIFSITSFYSINEQGDYYLILSLFSLQSFVDLGVGSVMYNYLIKEWNEYSSSDDVLYKEDKIQIIRGYFRFLLKWFILFSVVLFTISIVFSFFYSSNVFVFNVLLFISFLSTFIFFSNLFNIFIEGTGKFFSLYFFKSFQLLTSSILFFVLCYNGFGIVSMIYFYAFLVLSSIVYFLYNNSFYNLILFGINKKTSYFTDIFPFHFKIILQSIFGYLTWQAIIPIVYSIQGAESAGRLGFSVQIANLFLTLSTSIIYSSTPVYSDLILNKNLILLKRKWLLDLILSCLFFLILISIYFVLFFLDFELLRQYFLRALPPKVNLFILLIFFTYVVNQSIASITRLRKVEILFYNGIALPILSFLIIYFFLEIIDLQNIFLILLFINFIFLVFNFMKLRKFVKKYF
jgi:hypothetical protein